jgi:hypothetical protein
LDGFGRTSAEKRPNAALSRWRVRRTAAVSRLS